MKIKSSVYWLFLLAVLLYFDLPALQALTMQQPAQGVPHASAINWMVMWSKIWADITSTVFWIELYIHWVAICSFVARVLVPLEEWAHDPENCSVARFKKIHSFVAFLNSYGTLNKRANLGDFAVKELRQIQAKDDAQTVVDNMPPDGKSKGTAAGG